MLPDLFSDYVPAIEAGIRRVLPPDVLPGHYGMLRYHLGWADEHLQPVQADGGKRIRPVLCLLACQAVGGRREMALPAAAAQ